MTLARRLSTTALTVLLAGAAVAIPSRGPAPAAARPSDPALAVSTAPVGTVGARGAAPATATTGTSATSTAQAMSGATATAGVQSAVPEPWEELIPGVVRKTGRYGSHDRQTYDVYTAAGPLQARPTVLLIHGGSWVRGDRAEWTVEAVELARRGWTAVAVSYRLAPVDRWPAPAEDVWAALRHVRAAGASLAVDPERVGALGDSAGGHLAAVLGTGVAAAAEDRPVQAVVTWSGIYDLTGLLRQPRSGGCPALGCSYRGVAATVVHDLMACTSLECPEHYRAASPVDQVTRRSAPTLSIASAGELIDPRQAWIMDEQLRKAGVVSRVRILPGFGHGRALQPQAWSDTERFLAAALAGDPSTSVPPAAVTVSLDLPRAVEAGRPVRLRGQVRPAQPGSRVSLQMRTTVGWREIRSATVTGGLSAATETSYDVSWTPPRRGTTTWRAVWRGSGAVVVSPARSVRAA